MSETRGTGKWAWLGIPHRGWTCGWVEDLGEPSAICEMCEVQEIRYVHHMDHPHYHEELGVGCICAGHMEDDIAQARARETVLVNAASRKKRWLSRAWKRSRNGNAYLNTDGYNIVVFPKASGGWSFAVTERRIGYVRIQAKKFYPTQDAAALRAFDALIWLKTREQEMA